jgi:hypothetical protein
VKSSFTSPIVILPDAVIVPVESDIPELLKLLPVAAIVIDVHDSVEEPTANVLLSPFPVPDPIEIAPDTVKEFPALMETVFAVFPPFILKVLHTAAVLTVMVTVIPFGITTSCALVGTTPNDQFDPVFQFALVEPSQVLVCPKTALPKNKLSSKKVKVSVFELSNNFFINRNFY